jgi:hypothetical protein
MAICSYDSLIVEPSVEQNDSDDGSANCVADLCNILGN